MEKIRKRLFSENGMKIVNLLFLLLMFLRNRILAICTLAAWMVYLTYCVKSTGSKLTRAVYILLGGCAVVMILANLSAP